MKLVIAIVAALQLWLSTAFGQTSPGSVAVTPYATAIGVNFNSANTDTAIPIKLPIGASNYRIVDVIIGDASASISTATFGIFSATGGGGTVIVAGGTAITITASAANTANNMQVVTPATTESFSFATLYFRVGTAQGSAATADVILRIVPLY
jgi:hypothetical protein